MELLVSARTKSQPSGVGAVIVDYRVSDKRSEDMWV
jgi:hypothetical protein